MTARTPHRLPAVTTRPGGAGKAGPPPPEGAAKGLPGSPVPGSPAPSAPGRRSPEEGGLRPGTSPAAAPSPGVAAGQASGGRPGSSPGRLPATTPRTWTITLEPGTPILSANARADRYTRNRVTQDLKDKIAAIAACRLKLPAEHIGRADITVRYASPPRLRRLRHPLASDCVTDPDNVAPAGKALVDGLVKCGIWPGDSKKWIRKVTYELAPETHPRGLLTVTITEVTP
jgi:hypothetical protein